MPIYDYECVCGENKDDEFVTHWESVVSCDKCGRVMERQFPLRFEIDTFPKGGIHLKHIGPEGKTFYSKTEMKRFAVKHGLELGALL